MPVTPPPSPRRKALSEGDKSPPYPDSGYGSSIVTPLTSISSLCGSHESYHIGLFDGNDSADFEVALSDDESRTPETHTDTLFSRRSRTLPRLSQAFREALNIGASPEALKPTRRGSDVGPVRASGVLFRAPDRFLPSRDATTSLNEKFRLTRRPEDLTEAERLLRHSRASPDAFCYPDRRVAPEAATQRSISRSDTLAMLPRTRARTVLGPVQMNYQTYANRAPSAGSVWTVGGVAPHGAVIHDGHGNLVQSGTNATMYVSDFSKTKADLDLDQSKHEGRLAAALGIDLASKTLGSNVADNNTGISKNASQHDYASPKSVWDGTVWVKDCNAHHPAKAEKPRNLAVAPFRVLDAPHLRDDFYCSILAYSPTSHTLAVGLNNALYSWSETDGVKVLNKGSDDDRVWLTAIAFSSTEGAKSILAFGRTNRILEFMSLHECGLPRLTVKENEPVSALSWKPRRTPRFSKNPRNSRSTQVDTETLLVGDESGNISYYAIEWPEKWEVARDNWKGEVTLMARITIHQQQICGLSWSTNGEYFASGGNDNLCCLFDAKRVLKNYHGSDKGLAYEPANEVEGLDLTVSRRSELIGVTSEGAEIRRTPDARYLVNFLGQEAAKHRWFHGAAVKAIAFCPWQEDLVATGGGSNDKCIHFFHAMSGSALATISVSAQVTSLIWSTTKREIAATFGYAIPEHPVRVAVFSWPDCKQVAAIKWDGKHRALYAVPYPRIPLRTQDEMDADLADRRGQRDRSSSGLQQDASGCVVIAASDESIKFHEIWPAAPKLTVGGIGMLGGSEILEGLSGIDREGDIIR
ncbi:uncharacterized protein E0L32_010490 [Thyridium curvatum]|uniref:WD40 repeat-like protein n=1 Tax=Thyridium curvatum TaxID=1093900 RepID=A0A507AK81_9PEZI|nr:uncharacterized protein E0L32_010490 [Thyridium curvatum]TPX07803.1 hypothetical protein E0L32_010490 [Thyridium curvatum]